MPLSIAEECFSGPTARSARPRKESALFFDQPCHVPAPTDEETLPEAIAADQRRDVLRAWKQWRRDRSVEERVKLVSEEVMLCPWTVCRRLQEAGVTEELPRLLSSTPDKRGVGQAGAREKTLTALKKMGRATISELAWETGYTVGRVSHHLKTLVQQKRARQGRVRKTRGGKTSHEYEPVEAPK